ncbi:MAG: hypothetical protein AAGD01_13315 [Acidobacteriota bacterium]
MPQALRNLEPLAQRGRALQPFREDLLTSGGKAAGCIIVERFGLQGFQQFEELIVRQRVCLESPPSLFAQLVEEEGF